MSGAKVLPLRPFEVTRCQFCEAPWSSSVTLTITADGAYCTNRMACAGRQAAGMAAVRDDGS